MNIPDNIIRTVGNDSSQHSPEFTANIASGGVLSHSAEMPFGVMGAVSYPITLFGREVLVAPLLFGPTLSVSNRLDHCSYGETVSQQFGMSSAKHSLETSSQPQSEMSQRKRRKVGVMDDSHGYPCPVIGCDRGENNHTRLSGFDVWYSHIVRKHGYGYLMDGKRYRGVQRLGEKVAGEQGLIRCKVSGCSDSSKFEGFSELGQHLLRHHRDVLDAQPLNDISRKKHEKREKPTSELATSWSIGKRYQTRYGNGFVCNEHPTLRLKQTAKGFAQHWLRDHKKFPFFCPVATCSSSVAEEWVSFSTVKELYNHHMVLHVPAYLDEIRSETTEAGSTVAETGVSACEGGWLQSHQLCDRPIIIQNDNDVSSRYTVSDLSVSTGQPMGVEYEPYTFGDSSQDQLGIGGAEW